MGFQIKDVKFDLNAGLTRIGLQGSGGLALSTCICTMRAETFTAADDDVEDGRDYHSHEMKAGSGRRRTSSHGPGAGHHPALQIVPQCERKL